MAIGEALGRGIRRVYDALGELLYPSGAGCSLCGGETPLQEPGFCPACLEGMVAVPATACPRCGRPEGIGCCAEPYAIDGAAHALIYGQTARQAVHRLKYGNGRYLAPPLSQFMAEAWPSGWEVDGLVPVPLHPNRLRERGFNQSVALAQALSGRLNIPVYGDALGRIKDTPHQTRLTRNQRQHNLSGAFKARGVKGLRLVLIDDVYTTGSTADACARALRRAGAQSVHVMCLTVRTSLQMRDKSV